MAVSYSASAFVEWQNNRVINPNFNLNYYTISDIAFILLLGVEVISGWNSAKQF